MWQSRCIIHGHIHTCMHAYTHRYISCSGNAWARLFGWGDTHTHTHTHTQMILSGCWLWLYVGVVLLALPLCFFLFGLYICRKLFNEGSFKYTPTPQYSIKEIYRRSTKAAGCWAKVSTFLVAVLDIRYDSKAIGASYRQRPRGGVFFWRTQGHSGFVFHSRFSSRR